jgi:hypothetical protein
MKTASLQTQKREIQKKRLNNAREIHKLWRDSGIDIFRGRKALQSIDVVFRKGKKLPSHFVRLSVKKKESDPSISTSPSPEPSVSHST